MDFCSTEKKNSILGLPPPLRLFLHYCLKGYFCISLKGSVLGFFTVRSIILIKNSSFLWYEIDQWPYNHLLGKIVFVKKTKKKKTFLGHHFTRYLYIRYPRTHWIILWNLKIKLSQEIPLSLGIYII